MTEQKKSRFLPGLLLYLLILGLLLAALLFVFRDFLRVFEDTRPERALERWRAELEQNGPDEACRETLAALDFSLQDEEEALADAQKLLADARLSEDLTQSTDARRVYRLITDGAECGRLTLEKGEPTRYGFAPWELRGESFDFSRWFYRLSITVPKEYSVRCGETPLGRRYQTDRSIHYDALKECYELLDRVPVMVRYETGLLLSETALHVFDRAGREVYPEEQNEEFYLDNCSPELCERMEAYAERFIPAYVEFTSIKNLAPLLKSMMVPGSSVARRIDQALGDSWWGGGRYCKLLDSRVNRCVDLGEGHLLLDVSYETETREFSENVTDSFSMRLILVDRDGTLLAEHCTNY